MEKRGANEADGAGERGATELNRTAERECREAQLEEWEKICE